MKKAWITGIVFVVCFAGTCKTNPFAEGVYSITVTNNTPMLVSCFYQSNYPDTSLPASRPVLAGIRPNDYTFLDSKRRWEEVFAGAPGDTLSFFILSADTLNAFNWDEIRNRYLVLKRYDLGIQDIKNMNFKITFP